MHRLMVFAFLLLLGSLMAAQKPAPWFRTPDPLDNPASAEKVALGQFLFESPLLSQNRKISCATCHDPDASFADGLVESRGIFETEVGRNSPTLWGIGLSPGFMGALPPLPTGDTKIKEAPLLSLEDRCLSPIENPLEMGSSVKEAVRTLKAVPGLRQWFDQAFGKAGIGINGDRIGKAIAAYLRSVTVPKAPFRSFAEGDHEALREDELRGLAIFRGPGRCADCHVGPYLSDGKHHQVTPPGGFRQRAQRRKSTRRLQELSTAKDRVARRGNTRSPLTPGRTPDVRAILTGGPQQRPAGYGGQSERFTGVHTPTLWDVARTGPYFRDGSVEHLEVALRQHLSELGGVGRPVGMVGCGPVTVPSPFLAQIPQPLRPGYQTAEEFPRPGQLGNAEVADLVAFLRALSPRT